MENSPQYLFLASGVNNGEGFWIVGIKNCDENIFYLQIKILISHKNYFVIKIKDLRRCLI